MNVFDTLSTSHTILTGLQTGRIVDDELQYTLPRKIRKGLLSISKSLYPINKTLLSESVNQQSFVTERSEVQR